MNLTALPDYTDNDIWMLDDGRLAVVVDPGDAAPVPAALATRHHFALASILVTRPLAGQGSAGHVGAGHVGAGHAVPDTLRPWKSEFR
jgi:hydroxyacylglutathione hydrolase